ncbi:hypothetical protein SORBI_3007G127200 [Sorghum bicolor]|uniref:YTH domain-containing protein n=2 Tax=Sorghum bicolor TaxID=4558 RepID=A0A1B6PHI0_SORBI|nr:hypothetical protein SORBI_3007G127200 [Sorghum bicolor]
MLIGNKLNVIFLIEVLSAMRNENREHGLVFIEASAKTSQNIEEVNDSGHFYGMVEMVGTIDFQKDMDFWCEDKYHTAE